MTTISVDWTCTVNPYIGVSFDEQVHFDEVDHTFRVIVYAAENGGGITGPEYNGIAIFDVDYHTVVLDRHEQQDNGYYGPSLRQMDEFIKLTQELDWQSFREMVNEHPRSRIQYTETGDIRTSYERLLEIAGESP